MQLICLPAYALRSPDDSERVIPVRESVLRGAVACPGDLNDFRATFLFIGSSR